MFFQLVDEHAMDVPIVGTNEDGDNGSINCGALSSALEREFCVMAGLGGVAHGYGNGGPSNNAY
jgi:hypothetical protein